MTSLPVLFLGDEGRAEFRQARASLNANGEVASFLSVESAIVALTSGEIAPAVIVIAQAYPGQFSPSAVDRLRRVAPLARVVALLGSWCEGEARSGKPWPGTIRIYWHQWPARCPEQLRKLLSGRSSAWGLPATATDEERLLAAAEVHLPRRQGLIAIHERRAEMGDWLSAACRSCGYATVWLRPPNLARVQGAAALIIDGLDCRGSEPDEVRRLSPLFAPAPVIVLADFPRIEDQQRVLSAGAAAVISKPLMIEELLAAIG